MSGIFDPQSQSVVIPRMSTVNGCSSNLLCYPPRSVHQVH